jgi:hypothetical protein
MPVSFAQKLTCFPSFDNNVYLARVFENPVRSYLLYTLELSKIIACKGFLLFSLESTAAI